MLNVKTDAKLKNEAQKLAKEIGLPVSFVVNNALRRFVVERRIVAEAPLIPNKKTAKILDKAIAEIKAGNLGSGPFDTAEEMFAHLDNQTSI